MINDVVLIGRLTKDVEIRKTTSGKSVASYILAVGRDKEHTDFISCVAWEKTADLMSQYCHKGALIGIEGHIQTRSYDNQQGQRIYVTEVMTHTVQFLEPKKDAEWKQAPSDVNTYGYPNNGYNAPQNAPQQGYTQPQYSQPTYTQPSLTQQAEQNAYNQAMDVTGDDLPF